MKCLKETLKFENDISGKEWNLALQNTKGISYRHAKFVSKKWDEGD